MRNTSPLNRDIIMETIDQPLVTRSVSCINQINYSFMTMGWGRGGRGGFYLRGAFA